MDFHAVQGWLGVRVERGGLAEIDGRPEPVVVQPGHSLYFVSFWGDADTESGPCTRFDSVKITLPDNYGSARIATSGCVDPGAVKVGPVTSRPPA